MKMKITLLIYISILVSTCVYAQINNAGTNQFNSMGHKEGLWVDTIHNSRLRETYYKNGIESGIFKQYNLKGRLLVLGEYCKGKMCGTWYNFDTTGHLWFLLKDFSLNTFAVVNEVDGRKYIPDYKCYSISYYPNGNIEDEGLLLWPEGESPESDFSREYGEWKYYDESGKLVRIKDFK